MTLEDQTIAHSPEVEINLRTVSENKTHPLWLTLEGDMSQNILERYLKFGPDAEEFIKEFREGDKVIVIEYGGDVLAVYGPLEEEKLYIYPKKEE